MTSPAGGHPVVFIANRGEIAVRVIRAALDNGYRTAVVHVDADADAPYVTMATSAERVASATNPFLDVELLIAAAVRAEAEYLHPGYGFLAENADFARRVEAAGICWVGPDASAIAALGDKVSARAIAVAVGAPLVEGSDGPVAGPDDIWAFAARVGYPIAVKASYGGGGRGMRVIRSEDEIEPQLASARSEAGAAFGNDECFVEQYLDRPRHVETQCLADAHGNVSVVGTRDCSLQRRHQKVLEEAPAPGLTDEQLTTLTVASRDILRHVGYRGAATCEFLLSRDGVVSFLEVNTRIQVEHTVTEVVSGIDLVEQQLRIARGEEVRIPDHQSRGVAFEYRVNSEDPELGFLPSTGVIDTYTEPGGPWVRVDSGVRAGSEVTGAFDSMLAKLVVSGPTRDSALDRSRRALREFVVDGVRTTLPLFAALVDDPTVRRHGSAPDGIYTSWVEEEFLPGDGLERVARHSAGRPRTAAAPRTAVPDAGTGMTIRVDGRAVRLDLPDELFARLGAASPGTRRPAPRVAGVNVRADTDAGTGPAGRVVVAPTRGIVVATHVTDGETVAEDDPLVTIEVMKMEHTVRAPAPGRVAGLVPVGAEVSPTAPVLRLV
jgi:acetyl-CoA/propionyl-CoA carboxylase biotin carboxyl carrier protein